MDPVHPYNIVVHKEDRLLQTVIRVVGVGLEQCLLWYSDREGGCELPPVFQHWVWVFC